VGGKVSVATRGATTAFSTAGDVASLSVASATDAPRLVSAIADQAVTEDLAFSFTVPAGTFVEVDAGDSIEGVFTSVTLASGKIVAYKI
jgi:hypothetical protein